MMSTYTKELTCAVEDALARLKGNTLYHDADKLAMLFAGMVPQDVTLVHRDYAPHHMETNR